jgi:hypothetical protein
MQGLKKQQGDGMVCHIGHFSVYLTAPATTKVIPRESQL